jgi:hypothetical protein
MIETEIGDIGTGSERHEKAIDVSKGLTTAAEAKRFEPDAGSGATSVRRLRKSYFSRFPQGNSKQWFARTNRGSRRESIKPFCRLRAYIKEKA